MDRMAAAVGTNPTAQEGLIADLPARSRAHRFARFATADPAAVSAEIVAAVHDRTVVTANRNATGRVTGASAHVPQRATAADLDDALIGPSGRRPGRVPA